MGNNVLVSLPLEVKNSTFFTPMKEPKIITFFNHKGGVGKTTLAVNLAAAYAKMGQKTLVIDNDGQMNATYYLDVNYEFKDRPENMEGVYNQSLVEIPFVKVATTENLYLAPAGEQLERIGFDMYRNYPIVSESYFLLKKAIDRLEGMFDVIIIDSGPTHVSPLIYNALVASNGMIVPVDASGPNGFQGVQTVISIFNEIRFENLNPNLKLLGFLVNKSQESFSSKLLGHSLQAFTERSELRQATFKTEIQESRKLMTSQWKRIPITAVAAEKAYWKLFRELIKEINKKYTVLTNQ